MKKRVGKHGLLALLLCVQTAMLLVIAWNTAPGWDEWGHLPSGLFSLQYGDYAPYCVNPPLTRLWVAWPVWLCGGGIDYEPLPRVPGVRVEGFLGLAYIEQQREGVFFWMSLARTAATPISLLGTYLIWSIGERLFSSCGAAFAATLWVFSPTVLTFGASITPDVSAAVFGFLAAWRCYIWLRMGTPRNALWLGIASALAMTSKASWLIMPPVLILISLVYAVRYSRRWNWGERWTQAAIVAGTCWLTVHAAYGVHGMLQPLGRFEFVSRSLTGMDGEQATYEPGNRFRGSWLEYVPAPLPADYIQGIDLQKRDFESKMNSYFLGQSRDHGWWYYYVAGIFLKEPVALWFLGIAGVGTLGLKKKIYVRSRTKRVGQFVVLVPGMVLLLFVSSQTGFNHHLRYVLPFLPALYLLITMQLGRLPHWGRVVSVGLVGWYMASSVAILPRSYAYFTEAIGGAEHGWKYLGDSNLDWGQDLLTAKRWVDANPDKRPVFLVYSLPLIDFRKLGIDADDGRNSITASGPSLPGWWIVFQRPLLESKNRWFRHQNPSEKLSVSTSVFEIREDDL